MSTAGWFERTWRRSFGGPPASEHGRRREIAEAVASGMHQRDVESLRAEAAAKRRLAKDLRDHGYEQLARDAEHAARSAELEAEARFYGAEEWMHTMFGAAVPTGGGRIVRSRRVFEGYAVLAAVLIAAGWFAVFGLTANVATRDPTRIGMYAAIAAAAAVLAIGHVMLVERRRRESPPGLAPLWLVTVTYTFLAITLTVSGVLTITVLRIVLGVEPGAGPVPYRLDQFAWAMVGGSAVAFLEAAVVFVLGWRYGMLDLEVAPWPWTYFRKAHRDHRRNSRGIE